LVNAQVHIPSETLYDLQEFENRTQEQPYLVSFVGLASQSFSIKELDQMGIEIGSKIGNIVSVRIPSNALSDLSKLHQFSYLQLAQKIKPDLDRVIPDTRADSVHMGYLLDSSYSGKNVLIGITDWGFDYTHPMFYDTALEHTRILAAWDQFKTSGPAPDGFNYGTLYEGESELLAAQSDTAGVYSYATHGSHVAGIAGGSGAGTVHRGVAFDANFLFVQFLVDEAAVLDAFAWLYQSSLKYEKRLVVNMSWGLHHFGTLDGSSILSQAIDEYSNKGVVFVSSGGNNGERNFHIKHEFADDTIRTGVSFYPYSAHELMWGQSITAWGEVGESFGTRILVLNSSNQIIQTSPYFNSHDNQMYLEGFVLIGSDSVFYNLSRDSAHPLNQRPHMRLRIKNTHTQYKIGLEAFAEAGNVHFWNLTELTNDVGNWGMPFSAYKTTWLKGDNQYAIAEPACSKSVISVAAHSSEIRLLDGRVVGGSLTSFSSEGPTLDGRIKPDISGPGAGVASSVSSFTDRDYDLLFRVNFNGKDYPFSRFSGTSMSAPAVTGVVALMLQANPSLMPDQIKEIIRRTARYDQNTGELDGAKSNEWGWGKINASWAVHIAERTKPVIGPPLYIEELIFYPNPASLEVYLHATTSEPLPVKVYSEMGQLVLEGSVGNLKPLDVSFLDCGLYFLELDDGKSTVGKLFILR